MRYFIVFCLFLLSSCSFLKPLYGSGGLEEKLGQVEIEEIYSIIGSEIYFQLKKIMGRASSAKYSLEIKGIGDTSYPLAISKGSELVKQNVSQQYMYILKDKSDGKILDSGRVRIVGSYNVMKDSFNSYTNEKFTKKNMAQNVAEEIRVRLLLYFSSV